MRLCRVLLCAVLLTSAPLAARGESPSGCEAPRRVAPRGTEAAETRPFFSVSRSSTARSLCLAGRVAFEHGLLAASAQPQPSPDEFVPLSEVPPEEQIPAFGLIGAAYGFVWVVVVGYVWSLGRRLRKAEEDIAALERRR